MDAPLRRMERINNNIAAMKIDAIVNTAHVLGCRDDGAVRES